MGIDASSQIIFTSGRAPGVGAEHVLTKVHVQFDDFPSDLMQAILLLIIFGLFILCNFNS